MASTKTAPEDETQTGETAQDVERNGEASEPEPMKLNTTKYPRRLLTQEAAIATWYHQTEFGVTFEEVMRPEYWASVSRQFLRPGHRIIVDAVDFSWTAHLVVRAVGKGEAAVSKLSFVEFTEEAVVSDKNDFKVEWRGPTRKFGAIRKSDNAVVKENFTDEAAAWKWVRGHENALAA